MLRRALEHNGNPVRIQLVGSDERGLMYGLMELAEQAERADDAGDPFAGLNDMAQAPFVPERSFPHPRSDPSGI